MANSAVADHVLRELCAFVDTPRRRPGLTLHRIAAKPSHAFWYLLTSLLSHCGIAHIESVIKLERVLGELTENLSCRDPLNYAIAMFCYSAKADPILLRFRRHHLSLTAVVVPSVGVSVSPAFFCAKPAAVPLRHRHAGFRLLGLAEEGSAFRLLRSFAGGVRIPFADHSLGDLVAGAGRSKHCNRAKDG